MLIIHQHPEKRIKCERYESEIIKDQHLAQLMAVKPHQELINEKKNKNPGREQICNSQRNRIERNIRVQKIFLFQKALQPCSEGFLQAVFLQIVKLVNDAARRNTEQ